MIKNRTGYAPFSTGAVSCLGKQPALIGLRIVTARLVTTFDFEFTEGFKELDVRDCLTAHVGPLMLRFTKRNNRGD